MQADIVPRYIGMHTYVGIGLGVLLIVLGNVDLLPVAENTGNSITYPPMYIRKKCLLTLPTGHWPCSASRSPTSRCRPPA
jgi:hypothetical protein